MCNSLFVSCQSNFDKTEWKKHNKIESFENSRYLMIEDLVSNYLKTGLNKKEVINLLGIPYKDTVSFYLPKNIKLPDSLKIDYDNIKNINDNKKKINEISLWYKKKQLKAPMLIYPLGWKTMDPIFLYIRLSKEGIVIDFWVKQG